MTSVLLQPLGGGGGGVLYKSGVGGLCTITTLGVYCIRVVLVASVLLQPLGGTV